MKRLLKIVLILILLGSAAIFLENRYINIVPDGNKLIIDEDAVNESWQIVQYGDDNGNQMMCYTIEGNKHGLVIVDGGYYDDEPQAEYVRKMIKDNGGKVDAWILTHFDSDHAGLFEKIEETNPEFKINELYIQDVPNDIELLKENAPWEKEFDTFEKFNNSNYTNIGKINKVHAGDEYDFIGLKMKVLSSYDEWIDEESNNLLNNGSIIFKLYGNNESMIFCGDVQDKKIAEYIMENYGDDIPSDYIQVGHHGNNSFPKEFYELVNPKIAFFPAPTWLMDNISGIEWFTVGTIREWFKEMNTQIYWHKDTPASVIMY